MKEIKAQIFLLKWALRRPRTMRWVTQYSLQRVSFLSLALLHSRSQWKNENFSSIAVNNGTNIQKPYNLMTLRQLPYRQEWALLVTSQPILGHIAYVTVSRTQGCLPRFFCYHVAPRRSQAEGSHVVVMSGIKEWRAPLVQHDSIADRSNYCKDNAFEHACRTY